MPLVQNDQVMNAIAKLEEFLLEHYPDVVLIPSKSNKRGCDPSESKRPLWCHSGVTTKNLWAKWQREGRNNCAAGLLLVLRGTPGKQLIVVDVDDAALADALERLFPAMKATAIQATKKGRHLTHTSLSSMLAGG